MIDAIIIVLVVGIVFLIIRKLVLDRKRGVGCGSCPTGGNHCDCE